MKWVASQDLTRNCFPTRRERRIFRSIGEEKDKADADNLHGGTDTDLAGQLPNRLEPRRARPREDRPDHGTEQARDASLVPKLPGEAEEVHEHQQDEKPRQEQG